jgi:hypothetical protein
MRRAILEQHLVLAEKHIAIGVKNIARQREILAELEAHGHDCAAEQADRLLSQFEALQKMHEAERDRLVRELGEIG